MKSKWKAQKRKEGLVSPRTSLPSFEEDDGEDHQSETSSSQDGPDSEEDTDGDEPVLQKKTNSAEETESEHESADEDRDDTKASGKDVVFQQQRVPSRGGAMNRGRHSTRGRGAAPRNTTKKDQSESQTEEKPSLRELQNRAYSRSSLHTFKSHPLHKQHGSDDRSRNDRGRGRIGGFQNARGQARGRGRGQPDMRLRMNAMLEKIRRDFT